jgi:hypothetical protein
MGQPFKDFYPMSEVKEVDIEDHKKVVLNYSCHTSTTKPL